MITESKYRDLLLHYFEPEENSDRAQKEAFLSNLMAGQLPGSAKITVDKMLLIQAKYIRKTAWLTALLLLFAAAMVAKGNPESVFQIAALTPLLAFVTEIETRRSYAYGMAELEMTTRFSLRSIVFARFLLLGIFDLAVLSAMTLIIRRFITLSAAVTLSILLLPFLLTMTCALLLERTSFGRNHPYGSGVFALIAAAGTEGFLIPDSIIAMPFKGILLMQNYGWIWESTAILLMITVVILFFTNMKMEEERAAIWN